MDATIRPAYVGDLSGLGAVGRLGRYGACLRTLALRAVRVRYRRSVLGVLWSLLYPLISMAVLTVVFSRVFPELHGYALYVIIGVMAWGFFSLSCLQACDALTGASPILRKVYVPASVFPLAAVAANLLNLLLSLLILPLVAVAVGVAPGFHPFVLAAALAALVAFTTGVALALSAANVFLHDVRYFFEGGLLVWFYATPIVYPSGVIPESMHGFLWLNPFHWLLDLLRASLYSGVTPEPATIAAAAAVSVAALAAGWGVFARLERRFHLYL